MVEDDARSIQAKVARGSGQWFWPIHASVLKVLLTLIFSQARLYFVPMHVLDMRTESSKRGRAVLLELSSAKAQRERRQATQLLIPKPGRRKRARASAACASTTNKFSRTLVMSARTASPKPAACGRLWD